MSKHVHPVGLNVGGSQFPGYCPVPRCPQFSIEVQTPAEWPPQPDLSVIIKRFRPQYWVGDRGEQWIGYQEVRL